MNAQRRKRIEEARGKVLEAKEIFESVRDEEQEAFDNMPEGMQQGDKGEKAQAAISALEETVTGCEAIEESCDTAIE